MIQVFRKMELSMDFGFNIAINCTTIIGRDPSSGWLIGNASRLYLHWSSRDLNKIARDTIECSASTIPRRYTESLCPCYNVNQQLRSAVKELLLHYNPTESPLALFVISIDGILPYEYTINVCCRVRSKIRKLNRLFLLFVQPSSQRVNDGSNSKWNWFGWSGLRRTMVGGTEATHLQFRFQPLMLTPWSFVRIWPSSAGFRIKWIQIRKIDTLQPFHSFHCIRGAPHWFARGSGACCSVYKSALSISLTFLYLGIRATSNHTLSALFWLPLIMIRLR